MLACVVVAGGSATRMGPWAPKLKPFLGIGPWNDHKMEGDGPSVVYRALHNLHDCFAGYPAEELGLFVSANCEESLVLAHKPENVILDAVLRDSIPSPLLGPLRALEDADVDVSDYGVLLHNGDDLIHPASIHLVASLIGKFGAPTLLATRQSQYGRFGNITAANTIEEKPVLRADWFGAGLIYLPPDVVDYALANHVPNVSLLINQLYNTEGIVTRVVRSPHPWATVGCPEDYLFVCEDPTWRF